MKKNISIIMSTYARNHGDRGCPNLLRRAIESVLKQTYRNFEFIIIDDGSTDGTRGVCLEYAGKDERIRYVRHEENSGRPAIRYNEGMKLAECDYFMFMFDDDVLNNKAMAVLMDAITRRHKNCGMVFGNCKLHLPDGSIRWLNTEWDRNELSHGNCIGNLSVIVKKEAINEVGGYDESELFVRICDWDLWCRIGERFDVAHIDREVGEAWIMRDSVGSTKDLDWTRVCISQKKDRVIPLVGHWEKSMSVSDNRVSVNLKKIVFVCNGHDAMLKRWSLQYLCDGIQQCGVDVRILDLSHTCGEQEIDADVVVVFRCFEIRTLHLIKKLKKRGILVVYFLDDYIFQPGCRYTNGWTMPTEVMSEADCMMSSSRRLLTKMTDSKPVIFRPTVADRDTYDILAQQYRRGDVFNIGWFGGAGRGNMGGFFVYDMLKTMNAKLKSPGNCVFHVFGVRNYPKLKNIDVREHFFMQAEQWKHLYNKWKSFDLGAMINPLDENDEFCHCKSRLKMIESGAMGVPMISSRVEPYTDIVIEGENGFLGSTPEEFADKLLLLMKDEDLSRRISKGCRKYVIEQCDYQDNARQFLDDLKKVMGETEATRRNRTLKQPVKPWLT